MAKKALIEKQQRTPKFKVRGYTRCRRCGRPKSVYRKFGLCRICLRVMVHASGGVDSVVVDLGEDQLLGDSEGVVAVSVERTGGQPPEVADPGDGHGQQPVEELPRPVAPQGHLGPDLLALTKLERGDRLLGPGHHRLLAGDDLEVPHGSFDQRLLLGGTADAHVDHDLGQPGYLHDVVKAERLLELGPYLAVVALLEPGACHGRCGGHHRSAPHLRQTRTLRPWSSMRIPMRVGPQVPQTMATEDTDTGMNLSMRPPCMVAPEVL